MILISPPSTRDHSLTQTPCISFALQNPAPPNYNNPYPSGCFIQQTDMSSSEKATCIATL